MAWNEPVTITDQSLGYLRFVIRAVALIVGIVVTSTLCYILFRVCWFFLRFLERTVFSNPW